MRYFLLTYDRDTQRITDSRSYDASETQKALADREAVVLANRERPNVEIVLLGAEPFESLKRTHSRYFKMEAIEAIARSS